MILSSIESKRGQTLGRISLIERLFGTRSRDSGSTGLVEDHREEIRLAELIETHADSVPYTPLHDRMMRVSRETRLHAEMLAEHVIARGGSLLTVEHTVTPSNMQNLVTDVQADLEAIHRRRARYVSIRKHVPVELRDTIRQFIDDKDRHRADLRDVYVRLVR
jgi:hypothetical protein